MSQEGIIPVSKLFDTAGPMAKSVVDLANLLDVLIDSSKKETPGTYAEALPGKWSELRVGVLDPDEWFFDENLQKPVPAASEQIVNHSSLPQASNRTLTDHTIENGNTESIPKI